MKNRKEPLTLKSLSKEGLSKLSSGSLLPFIEWLDLTYVENYSTSSQVLREFMARLTLALGRASEVEEGSRMECTLSAASAYLLEPSESAWSEFFRACSGSYPFGPGEGCYGIEELGHGRCGLGSGCRSGAGFLSSGGQDRGRALEEVRNTLLDWV